MALLDANDYMGALNRFQQAYAHFPAPTLMLFIARAQLKLGNRRAARRSFRKVANWPLGPNDSHAFRRARATARNKLKNMPP